MTAKRNLINRLFIIKIYFLSICGLFFCVFISCNTPNSEQSAATIIKHSNNLQSIDSIEQEKHFLYSQKNTYEYQKPYNDKIINELENNRDTGSILAFLQSYLAQIFKLKEIPFSPLDILEYTFQIDINNDGEKDIIYQGPAGGEENMTVIFINENNSYTEVFRKKQVIFEIEFIENRLSNLAINNVGCCADPQVLEYYYKVNYQNNRPNFSLTRTIGYLSDYEKPINKFEQEIPFIIQNDEAKLRNDCYELNTLQPFYGTNGNILNTYKKGDKGIAIAHKIENGTQWVYVLMAKKMIVGDTDFYTFREQEIELYGWLKKRETNLK